MLNAKPQATGGSTFAVTWSTVGHDAYDRHLVGDIDGDSAIDALGIGGDGLIDPHVNTGFARILAAAGGQLHDTAR